MQKETTTKNISEGSDTGAWAWAGLGSDAENTASERFSTRAHAAAGAPGCAARGTRPEPMTSATLLPAGGASDGQRGPLAGQVRKKSETNEPLEHGYFLKEAIHWN